ncbi:hypothetical protein OROMI_003272 [Orobanche minor]
MITGAVNEDGVARTNFTSESINICSDHDDNIDLTYMKEKSHGCRQRQEEENSREEENNGTLIDGELVLSVENLQEIQYELDNWLNLPYRTLLNQIPSPGIDFPYKLVLYMLAFTDSCRQKRDINQDASEEVLEIERKYNEIRKPAYVKRNEIIKSIPYFWSTAFTSHPALSEFLTEEDEKVFKFLNNLEVEDLEDVKSGYSITFNFNPNPYFENAKLTKTFTFLEEGITKIAATSIKWKEGMGIHKGVVQDKKGNKRSNAEGSFFTWFDDSKHLGDIYDVNDEVADIIKEDLWPNPLTYFQQ